MLNKKLFILLLLFATNGCVSPEKGSAERCSMTYCKELVTLGATLTDKEVEEYIKLEAIKTPDDKNNKAVIAKIHSLFVKAKKEPKKAIKLTEEQKERARNYACKYAKTYGGIHPSTKGKVTLKIDDKFINNTLSSLPYDQAIEVFRFIIEELGNRCLPLCAEIK